MTCLIHVRGVIQARLDPEFKRNDNPTYEQLSSIAPRSVLESVEVQIIRFSGGAYFVHRTRVSAASALRLDVGLHERARSFRRQRYHGIDLATHAAGSSGHTSRPEKRRALSSVFVKTPDPRDFFGRPKAVSPVNESTSRNTPVTPSQLYCKE